MALYKDIAYGNIGALTNASGEVLISSQTASSSANLTFTTGIDSTYKIYKFRFINIHPETDAKHFAINFRDGGSNYDAAKMTTFFQAQHNEAGNDASLGYNTSGDLDNGTGIQNLDRFLGNDADQSLSGELFLYEPSSTTFVKHFIARCANANRNDYAQEAFLAGYSNHTAAIDGVQFTMSSGNIDSGTINMYGIK
tara:strand:- start:261 stop:848 length:588 start_codon:yes stop_codon:yes gene_type:complete